MQSFLPRASAKTWAVRLTLFAIAIVSLAIPRSVHAQGSGYWHTSGNRILDADGKQVRIAGINWYGFETSAGVVHGLTSQDYRAVLQTIKSQGYNTLRLPFSNQMVEIPNTKLNISYSNATGSINTDLYRMNSLEAMDRVIAYAGRIGLKVILDNHRSESGDGPDATGLWYSADYPEASWINDWVTLAKRYDNNPAVIGFDLRNEPHNAYHGGACWDCGGEHDWHLAAQRAGNAILAANPKLLIFVEGTDTYGSDRYWWGGNLEGVTKSPVTLAKPGHLVYSAHEYGPRESKQAWFGPTTNFVSLSAVWNQHWAFVSAKNIAPVWLGEFGTTNNSADIQNDTPGTEGQWFQSLVQFLSTNNNLSWSAWALNGEDSYGLLDANYNPRPANPLKQNAFTKIQFQFGATGSSHGTSAVSGFAAVLPSKTAWR